MLTLPNLLTLSRILAVPILVFLLWPGAENRPGVEPNPGQLLAIDYALAFVLYCLMGITDYFDGLAARASGRVSRLGQFLDPIADKIMVGAVILLLVFTGDIYGFHVIAALIILLREIIVSGLREFLAGISVSVPVSQLAKWKTTFQLVAFGGLILTGALETGTPLHVFVDYGSIVLLWAAAVLTLVTGWDYLRIGLRHMD